MTTATQNMTKLQHRKQNRKKNMRTNYIMIRMINKSEFQLKSKLEII